MWGEGGVLQKMMDDAERGGYVSFPLDYYKLCQNLPIFYVKIMIFIKVTIFIFITVNSSDKKVLKFLKRVYIRYTLVCISYAGIQEFRKKMTSSFREGGRGQPKDDSGLCGGRGGSQTPQNRMMQFPNGPPIEDNVNLVEQWTSQSLMSTGPPHYALRSLQQYV